MTALAGHIIVADMLIFVGIVVAFLVGPACHIEFHLSITVKFSYEFKI